MTQQVTCRETAWISGYLGAFVADARGVRGQEGREIWPVSGWFAAMAGTIFVDRGRRCGEEVCYWKDMILLPRQINLLSKSSDRAQLSCVRY
jgi:hypothetical protein